jgi:tRNA(fMet)-specific endonuclease VapC
MSLYMLDTNTASYMMRNTVRPQQVYGKDTSQFCISSITKGELLFGLAKKPSQKLEMLVSSFLDRVTVIAFDSRAAQIYGKFRAQLLSEGWTLEPLDLLIAAHSIAMDAILVTNDRAFSPVSHHLKLENWMQ